MSGLIRPLKLSAEQQRHLLPPDTVIAYMPASDRRSELYDVESARIQKAVAKRQNEFSTGRVCARQALAQLGVVSAAIPMGGNREPIFPNGVLASITHDDGICICIATHDTSLAAIGIDITKTESLEPGVRKMVCGTDEIDRHEQILECQTDPYKIIFSAKESLYKSLFPAAQRYIGFNEVSVTLHPDSVHGDTAHGDTGPTNTGRTNIGTWSTMIHTEDLHHLYTNDEYDKDAVQGRYLVSDERIITSTWIHKPRN